MIEIILPHLLALLFWIFVLLTIYLILEIRDWWRYHPTPNRLRCKILGHDYHDGMAQNLPCTINGESYLYDFCQRCHTEQNRRLMTTKPQPGQSLVETAIILPVLLIILIGVFEVGMLLRSYLILTDASREAARFTSKTSQVEIGNEDSYLNAVDHTRRTLVPLNIDFVETGDMIITIIAVDTGWPCDPTTRANPVTRSDESVDYWPNCECQLAATYPYTPWIVITDTYQTSQDVQTQIDIDALAHQMAKENELLNCQAVKTALDVELSDYHEAVIVELFYTHRLLTYSGQSVGLYAKTMMRRIGSRK